MRGEGNVTLARDKELRQVCDACVFVDIQHSEHGVIYKAQILVSLMLFYSFRPDLRVRDKASALASRCKLTLARRIKP